MTRTLLIMMLAGGVALCSWTLPTQAQSDFYHFAEHTPGFKKVAEGSRAYERGWYFDAYHDWLWAAWRADKTAQYNIGVMHYHGQHVERSLPRAWAWFRLSAERGYPMMIETAEQVAGEMNEAQLELAQSFHLALLDEYGDDIAVPRTQRFMDRERRRMTGSRVGAVSGMLRIVSPNGLTRDGQDFYDKRRWSMEHILQREAELWSNLSRARVELKDLEIPDDD